MKPSITIGGVTISRDGPVFLVGEIGNNHNGSIETALALIDMAVECGLDAVKFQKRVPELSIPEKQKTVLKETPWGTMSYLEYRRKLEFGRDQYRRIESYCREKNIIWFASPWDLPSVEFLEEFDVPCYKVPSAQLTNRELLLKLRKTGKPVLLSTGMSTETEIKKAVALLGQDRLVLMHCNSSYPARDEELNLNYIPRLLREFPETVVGYSGHEKGISASIVAAALGARVIERHITLDRTMWGTDHAASLEFPDLRQLSRDLKKLSLWLGDGVKKVTESEKVMKQKLRNIDSL